MPTIGSNSKPAYVYDAGTDTWIPIGPGEHTHDYIGKDVITTTGDIIYASAANTPARLGIGSSGQVLSVSGGVPAWTAPSNSGMTLLSTTPIVGTTTAVSNINQTYNDLLIYIFNVGTTNSNPNPTIQFNSANLFQGSRLHAWDTTLQTASVNDNNFNSPNNWSGGAPTQQFAHFLIRNYANTVAFKGCEATLTFRSSDPYDVSVAYFGKLKTTSAITSMTFTMTGSTGITGTILIYGVK